jgi:multiple sugar transport system permease protein
MRNSRLLADVRKNRFYYAILAPAAAVVLFLTVYPIAEVMGLSFFRYNYLSDTRLFIGFRGYLRIAGDELFRTAYLNTVLFAAAATVAETVLGFAFAVLFYGRFPGKRVLMIVIIFPMMLSTMVICAVWRTLFQFDIGLFNYVMRSLGLPAVGWLNDQRLALWSVVLVDIWQWTPFAFIVLQASLLAVPRELFEAASLDGAGYLRIVFGLTIPILLGQILLVLLLRTIDTFRVFAKVYALTGGGPGNATETVSFFIYREGFVYFNLGRASTASMYVLVFIAAVAFLYIRRIMREENL